jgi:simple sugar transport system ATP-binding protein
VGDNGAGKSTLLKILAGADLPDEGAVVLDGAPVLLSSPVAARMRGIETVYQDLALAADLSVADNMFLGRELGVSSWVGRALGLRDTHAMQARAREALDALRIEIPSVTAPVARLSGGQRQAVAIARAVMWAKAVVLLDEPTAALGVVETNEVIDVVRSVRNQGLGVLVVSHSVEEVYRLADRIVVLRNGRKVGDRLSSELPEEELLGLMTGLSTRAGAGGGG